MRDAMDKSQNTIDKIPRWIWQIAQYVFVAALFYLIGRSLYTNWQELAAYDWDLDIQRFTLSVFGVSAMVLTLSLWWTWSIHLLQGRLGWKQGIRIWATAQLARYLPGGFWNYVSRYVATRRAGVPQHQTALSLVIETVLRVQAAIIVFLFSLPWWPTQEWTVGQLIGLSAIVVLGLVVLYPPLLNQITNWILGILQRDPVDITVLTYKHILGLLMGHILTVVGCGLAFFLMVSSVHAIPLQAAWPQSGMFAISVILGFLNPLTPQGLGTREGILILLLNTYLPLPIAILVALLSRLWLALAELVGVLFITILLRPRHPSRESEGTLDE